MSQEPLTRKRAAVLISGRGSNMRSLVEAAREPGYPAEIVLVISNRPGAPGLVWARDQGIPALAIDHEAFPTRDAFEDQLQRALVGGNVELVVCAGFMRLMTSGFVERWRNRMLNIHPSLLPAFKGLNTHQRALDAGVKISGCTVHIVRPEMDAGPVIAQAAVPVLDDDNAETLAERILSAEHQLYPEALRLFCSDKTLIDGEKVKVLAPVNQPSTLFSPSLYFRNT